MSRRISDHARSLIQTLRLLAMLMGAGVGVAQAQRAEEYHLKAAVLVNLGAFVEWPTAKAEQDMFVIGVVGRDPFGDVLDQLVHDQQLKGRQVIVRRLHRRQDVTNCHVLFIGRSETGTLREVLATLRDRPVLTVSDIEGFTAAGGMIGLSLERSRVVLHANPRAMQAVNLSASSKLLRLARIPPPAALRQPGSRPDQGAPLYSLRPPSCLPPALSRAFPRIAGARA